MRIDGYNKVTQIYEAQSTSRLMNQKKELGKDKVEISSTGKDIQTAKEGLKQVPDIRKDKVFDILKRMEAGTYDVSAKTVADKLVDKFFDQSI